MFMRCLNKASSNVLHMNAEGNCSKPYIQVIGLIYECEHPELLFPYNNCVERVLSGHKGTGKSSDFGKVLTNIKV